MACLAKACHHALMRKAEITVDLVSRLVRAQFPQWGHLTVQPVDIDGWDNATFRLGKTMSIRLPSAEHYVEAVEKEHRWLPILAGQLPLPVPQPLGLGVPGCGFPRPWSVYRWIEGSPVTMDAITDLPQFAADLADFLAALYKIDPADGPLPGTHNFFRGGPLTVYDDETREALQALEGHIDTALAAEVWQAALGSARHDTAVWFMATHSRATSCWRTAGSAPSSTSAPAALATPPVIRRLPGRSCQVKAPASSSNDCQ